MPKEDAHEVATEGQDRPGPYIVRKGHFVLIDDDGPGPAVPSPHRLAWRWKRLTNERIVFLVRDPRDICVSGAWHWQVTPEQFLERMIKGDVARCGRWDEYVNRWLDFSSIINKAHFRFIKYETLLKNTKVVVWDILDGLIVYHITADSVYEAINRQSFSSRAAKIGDNEQELRRNNMRKGIAGDWRNHFTPAMNERIWNEFGWMMEKLGYEKS